MEKVTAKKIGLTPVRNFQDNPPFPHSENGRRGIGYDAPFNSKSIDLNQKIPFNTFWI